MKARILPKPQDRYDLIWAAAVTQALDQFLESLGGDNEVQGKLITLSGRRRNVTLVTAASYTILLTDEMIDVNRAGAVTLTLPEGATIGQSFRIRDASGDASSNNITIARSASINVNGGASVTLSTDYGKIDVDYNGTQYLAA
jgi:hypothetical protein